MMKKQKKKGQQIQPKSWKVWFYTILLPLTIFLLLSIIRVSVFGYDLGSIRCNSKNLCAYVHHMSFLTVRDIFYIVFIGYYFLCFVFSFFVKQKYFSWKIFWGVLLLVLIDSSLLYYSRLEEKEDVFKISEEELRSN